MSLFRNRIFQLMCLSWIIFPLVTNMSDCISYQRYEYQVCPRLNGFSHHNERVTIFQIRNNQCCFDLESQQGQAPTEHCFPILQRLGSRTQSWLPAIGTGLAVVTAFILIMLISFEIDQRYRIDCNQFTGASILLISWAVLSFSLLRLVNDYLSQARCETQPMV